MSTQPKFDWLFEYEETLDNGQTVHVDYDREGDVLEVVFVKGSGQGIELSEEIVLRYDDSSNQPLSLILLGFSHFIQPTEYGPEIYLTGLEHLPAADRTKILQMLTSAPVDRYLRVSALVLSTKTPNGSPIAYARPQLAVVSKHVFTSQYYPRV
ncbi:MAG: hypothetical protein ACOYNY_38020 [Caldilineaceae bacterium]